jgi:hypothetical protein
MQRMSVALVKPLKDKETGKKTEKVSYGCQFWKWN